MQAKTSSKAETDAGRIDGVLDLGAQRAVAAVARPLGLALFVVAAALAVVAGVFRRDPDWTPAWLLVAAWSLAVWAEGGALRSGPQET
jgi:hypothetical protein